MRKFIKWFIHTKWGAYIGFHLGVSGFNRVDYGVVGGKMYHAYNARVNRGASLIAYLISNNNFSSLTSPSFPLYIALSTSTLSIGAGDTTLTGETSATGPGRALGTAQTYTAPVTLDGGASYLITKTFTNSSGGTVTLLSSALFDAASTGNMFCEANFTTSLVLINGQQGVVTWTVNI